jgi:transcriptional regulator with XRE-family HTH domain
MSSEKSFGDIAGRLKKRIKERETASVLPLIDFEAVYPLRRRILGVLIRDARQAAGKTVEECAGALGVSAQAFTDWEYGEASPSLPQVEVLAYILDVPVSHFWGTKTIAATQEERHVPTDDYIELRNRIIGALLRRARKEGQFSQQELAARVGVPGEAIERYEFGQWAIPLTELTSMASATNVPLSYFLEETNRVGEWLTLGENFKRFCEMPAEMRSFVAQPVNRAYLELAMRLSRMSVEELRGIAEGILSITY